MAETPTFAADLSSLLVRDIDTFIREIELFPDDDSLWKTMPGVSNSAGTLALHCAGNLQHFVGGLVGGSGYVRDRAREFSQRTGTRAELMAELGRAREAVTRALAPLSESALELEFPEAVGGVTLRTRRFLLHLAVHLGFHLGQVDYLRRLMNQDSRTADTVSVRKLADHAG